MCALLVLHRSHLNLRDCFWAPEGIWVSCGGTIKYVPPTEPEISLEFSEDVGVGVIWGGCKAFYPPKDQKDLLVEGPWI